MNESASQRKRPLAKRLAEHPLFGSPEEVERFRTGFQSLMSRGPTLIRVTPLELFCVLCQVQLAARHPHNQGPSRELAERTTREWERALGTLFPTLRRYFAAGWDPSQDIPGE